MKKVQLAKEMIKRLEPKEYYTEDNFINDCQTYIKALRSGRVQYIVTHVSKSGMSRDILIQSFEGKMTKGYYRTYTRMLEVLGYKMASNYSNDIKVGGCGMSMTFKTNYDICRDFKRIGLINTKECEILEQII